MSDCDGTRSRDVVKSEARVEILQLESAQDTLRNEISRLNRSWEVANARCAALEKEKEAYLRALEEQSVERRLLESLNAKADAQKQVLCENEKLLQEKIDELSEHKTQQEARITKLDTELQQALKDVSEKQQEISKLQDAIASEKEAQVQLRTQLSNAAAPLFRLRGTGWDFLFGKGDHGQF